MTPPPLLLLLLLLLTAARAFADSSDSAPTPTPWPPQFHAKLLMDYRGNLSLVDLWYDWPGGRNLHVIRYQLVGADAPYYDAEWNNGTSFFYSPARRACRSAEVSVGILRPDWLSSHGAAAYLGRATAYLGRATANGFDCHAWAKAGFITYYEDVRTRRPVKWVFLHREDGACDELRGGSVLEDAEWQAPAYCFAAGAGAGAAYRSRHGDGVMQVQVQQHDGEGRLLPETMR